MSERVLKCRLKSKGRMWAACQQHWEKWMFCNNQPWGWQSEVRERIPALLKCFFFESRYFYNSTCTHLHMLSFSFQLKEALSRVPPNHVGEPLLKKPLGPVHMVSKNGGEMQNSQWIVCEDSFFSLNLFTLGKNWGYKPSASEWVWGEKEDAVETSWRDGAVLRLVR